MHRIRILTQGDLEGIADLIVQGKLKAAENKSGNDDCSCINCRVRRAIVDRPDLEELAFSAEDSRNIAEMLPSKLLQVLASDNIRSEQEAMHILAQSMAMCAVAGYLAGEERGWKKAMEEE